MGSDLGVCAHGCRSLQANGRGRNHRPDGRDEGVVGTLITRIGGDGPVVAASDATGWQLIVRAETHASGVDSRDLHVALRELALRDRALARDAFGVICNCAGAWEDEYTEEHGEDALTFEDWMERTESGGITWVNEDGELNTSL
jgi:hypothetical protein